MRSLIRLAQQGDAEQMLGIYAPVVRDTAISFEVEPPSPDEFRQRIRSTLEFAPWLVCDLDGVVAGYVYASRFRTRAAYQWSAEVTVYIDPRFHRRGVGTALYTSLFECLKLQGFYNALAGITLPNPGSVALHENLGFELVGVYSCVGYKLGKWHDVGWWQLSLRPFDGAPGPLKRPAELAGNPAWKAALQAGVRPR